MRKILLATTALIGVAFAGAAHAAAPASPISLNVGGYNDFVAGVDNGGAFVNTAGQKAVHKDFEDEFKISFDATGKASNGVEYGANVSLWNGAEAYNTPAAWGGGGTAANINSAYVWLSGSFGKALFGDEHGASDLFVYAPTVGEGQVDGRFTDFVDSRKIASFLIRPSGSDNTEHSTKVTYYTPKVGNDTNKVQLGVSYAPNLYDYGQSAILATSGSQITNTTQSLAKYNDNVKGVLQYTGNFKPVNVTASAEWNHGGGTHVLTTNPPNTSGGLRTYDSWGLGTQIAYNGFTFGGAYNDLGAYGTVAGQDKEQNSFNLGVKYEIDKVGVGISYIHGKGYDNLLTSSPTFTTATAGVYDYVKSYNAAGAGATYTWFPGLTSNVDGVVYGQKLSEPTAADTGKQGGYTVLVSQRLAF